MSLLVPRGFESLASHTLWRTFKPFHTQRTVSHPSSMARGSPSLKANGTVFPYIHYYKPPYSLHAYPQVQSDFYNLIVREHEVYHILFFSLRVYSTLALELLIVPTAMLALAMECTYVNTLPASSCFMEPLNTVDAESQSVTVTLGLSNQCSESNNINSVTITGNSKWWS